MEMDAAGGLQAYGVGEEHGGAWQDRLWSEFAGINQCVGGIADQMGSLDNTIRGLSKRFQDEVQAQAAWPTQADNHFANLDRRLDRRLDNVDRQVGMIKDEQENLRTYAEERLNYVTDQIDRVYVQYPPPGPSQF